MVFVVHVYGSPSLVTFLNAMSRKPDPLMVMSSPPVVQPLAGDTVADAPWEVGLTDTASSMASASGIWKGSSPIIRSIATRNTARMPKGALFMK